jgi:hypothetical protein
MRTEGLGKEGCLLGQIRDGVAELSTARVEVGGRKALGDEDVALDVLPRLPGRRRRSRWGGLLGLRGAVKSLSDVISEL